MSQIGHAGTLDPMATGLLIICTGKATKSIDSFQAMHKEYSGQHAYQATSYPQQFCVFVVETWQGVWYTMHRWLLLLSHFSSTMLDHTLIYALHHSMHCQKAEGICKRHCIDAAFLFLLAHQQAVAEGLCQSLLICTHIWHAGQVWVQSYLLPIPLFDLSEHTCLHSVT